MIIYPETPNSMDNIGAKARNLARLRDKGILIPAWFAVSPDAFYASLNLLQAQSLEDVDFSAVIGQLQPSLEVQQELEQALAKLCPHGEMVAVRSSAIDEDGMMHSFAGQLESYLNVKPEDVAAKVAQVWRSGFSDRILAYRREHQLGNPRPPAVLVQKMVNAEVAGVAFAADPVTGQRGIVVISAVLGLGDRLVSGEVNGDTYRVNRQGKIVQQDLEDSEQPILTEEQVRAIAQLARRVSQKFNRPQDIEWAIENGQVYLLQSRPITGLADLPEPDGLLQLWDNSNIAESYNGITTPLTFSFARRAYEEVYRQFCQIMGVRDRKIAQHADTFSRMLGLIRGRVYYNLISWYKVLALLPGFQVNRRFMEQMMGVSEGLPEEIVSQLSQANWQNRLRDSLDLVGTLVGLGRNYFTLPRQIQKFYQRLNLALLESRLPAPLTELRPDELTNHYRDLEKQLLTRWDAPLVNDFFAMIFYGVLRKLTQKWCSDNEGTLQNDLISGEGGMISAEPAKRVQLLAELAAKDPAFVQFLCESSAEVIFGVMEEVPGFSAQYTAYLDKFGDRCLGELKLESPTLHDNPLPLLRSIGQLAQSAPPPPPKADNSLRLQAEQRVAQHLSASWQRLIFNWVLKNARNRVRDRENLRFERTRVFGRVRRIFVELGKRLYALDRLADPRDIFYLEVDEALGFVEGTATCTDLKGLVELRKAEFASYAAEEVPGDRFETRGIVYQGNRLQSARQEILSQDSDIRKGIGCCPGIIKAKVRVIDDPLGVVVEKGSILVAERTDPGWIMLFPAASGLLVERGSLLSHSAIVARELGIPAIVSLAGVTQWLQDGDWVEMDGSTGIIRKIQPEDERVAETKQLQQMQN
ncbi:phosphoenolpyruvate synthase [Desertifilum sp. FACHB-1129]|uniref:Phosphoenolpyruvate synthase n=1 Tax=Desertifilum tharense IPPAS B-1220 TaxID=1781255 RepID=A0A1E5QP84_9CYAN|nr:MULTISPECIES: PEP/pyruvate-binding domain-containing protein [Desertifilum]MBD2312672.1 phosphoenolpyruvate synthase [Desertifilum sp. FACHB-1129]MBD2320153.1 phosphoenolpyruvate synthase [Desertifilum sp. FACHB-866]MBD2330281.1 phosphoenolpyruvate synthase [Desertifilum sp. FACHB-868]OEJ76470.1 phosphoenolpyruvate synthase [Desertifilum tharense IPPAS B-1220]